MEPPSETTYSSPFGVGPEAHHLPGLVREHGVVGDLVAVGHQRPDPRGAVVAVDVRAPEGRDGLAAVHEPAGHRAAVVAVLVLEDRHPGVRGVLVIVVAGRSLVGAPAEVGALPRAVGRRDVVDLLDGVLPDVADPEVAGGGVEGEPPRVAQPGAPDLRPCVPARRVRVVRGDGVGGVAVGRRVDAEQLRQQRGRLLTVALRIALRAAVAVARVEQAVRPEQDAAPVVVGERLVDRQHLAAAGRVDAIGGHRVLVDAGVAVVVRVADVEVAAVGREGQVEQALLAPGGRPIGHVQHLARRAAVDIHREDPAGLLRHVEDPVVVDDGDGLVEAPDLGQLHRHVAEVGGRRRARRGRRAAGRRGRGGRALVPAAADAEVSDPAVPSELPELEHAASRRSATAAAGRARAMPQPAPRGTAPCIAQGTTRMSPSCTTVTTRWPSWV